LNNFCTCSNENFMEILVRLLLLFIINYYYLLLLLSDKSITLESRAYVYVTFLSVSDLRNKILQLKHRVLKHAVYKVISYFAECVRKANCFKLEVQVRQV
jgi:hypothetical protein